MEQRPLGRTGHQSTIAIFGTAAFWEISQEQANRALDRAMLHGVNHIDVAPQYGQAEERLGHWLAPHRDRFFLGCKTLERKRDAAWAELHHSLEMLHTDHLDLYQLHAVGTMAELDEALGPGGAIEAFEQARNEGLVRHLGITGHGSEVLAVQLAALDRFDFETIMFPINPRLYADLTYRQQAEQLLAKAMERNVGVMIIKAIARGPWGEHDKEYTTWYRPLDTPTAIAHTIRFALSQPGVTAVVSAGDVRLLPMILQAAEGYTLMSNAEQEALIAEFAHHEPLFV